MTGEKSRASTKAKLYALGAFLLGVGLIVAGGVIDALDEYQQSICVNAGTAMALFAPLLLLERQLDRRITDVGRETEAIGERARVAARQVGDLSARVQAGLEQIREEDRGLRERAATGNNQADLVALYVRAADNGSIDRLGLRIPAPGLFEIWIRIRVVSREIEEAPIDLVELSFENLALKSIGEVAVWSPEQPVDEVFIKLATGLQRANAWQGDGSYQPEAILGALADALSRIIKIWSGPGGNPEIRPIAALLESDWAVTRMGLDSLRTPDVWAESYELTGDTHHAFMRMEHQVKVRGWDDGEFRMAFAEAERVHEAFARNRPTRD